jgi:hypothetical protein
MASISEPKIWETFFRRPSDLQEGVEIPLALRDLSPGRKKYQMRHVVAVISRKAEELAGMDRLKVRTVVGVLLPEPWGIKIVRDLPIEVPGQPYRDFFESLRTAANANID